MRHSVLLAVFFAAGCSAVLPVPPPSPTYDVAEGDAVRPLSKPEQAVVDMVNAKLVADGYPKAELGRFEMMLAALHADVSLSKAWSTSGRKILDFEVDPDEPAGMQWNKLHLLHHYLARGVVPLSVSEWVEGVDWEQRRLRQQDLDEKIWPALHPSGKIQGKLRIGVAILADGVDNQRYFSIVLRDDKLDLDKGPPREAKPGETFELSGTLRAMNLRPLKLAVLRPDAKVDEQIVDVAGDGRFTVSYQIPAQTGRYLVALGPGASLFTVPLFVGTTPAPWPGYATLDAVPPNTARDAAKEFAAAVETWRKGQGLTPVRLPSDLCAFAKAEAKRLVDDPLRKDASSWKDRARAAGLDPAHVTWHHERWRLDPPDDKHGFQYWEDFVTRAPWDPFQAAALGSTKLGALGVGLVTEPQKSDDDPKFADLVWIGVEGDAPSASN
jgi:hypothetical protein